MMKKGKLPKAIAMIFVVFLVAPLLAGTPPGGPLGLSPPSCSVLGGRSSPETDVRYHVECTSGTVDLSFTDGYRQWFSQTNQLTPWEHEFTVYHCTSVRLSASNRQSSGTVTARIYDYRGVIVREESCTGGYCAVNLTAPVGPGCD
jgi:hypothetical protein